MHSTEIAGPTPNRGWRNETSASRVRQRRGTPPDRVPTRRRRHSVGSSGTSDGVFAAYAADGTHLFSRQLGGSDGDHVTKLSVSADGVLFVTGSISGPVSVAGDPIGSSTPDAFVAAYRVR